MPDTLPVPGAGATPPEPSAIPYSGAPVPPPQVRTDFAADVAAITLRAGAATRLAPKLAGATALAALTITDAGAALTIVDATLPDSLAALTFGTGCAAGDWPDALIAALPDRSGADDGTYTDTETILTAGQIAALEAKGFFEAV